MSIHAYLLDTSASGVLAGSEECKSILAFCHHTGLLPAPAVNTGPEGCYGAHWWRDGSTAKRRPLHAREAGRAMLRRAKAGDVVIVARLSAFGGLADFLRVLRDCRARTVRLYVLDLPGGWAVDLSGAVGSYLERVLPAFTAIERATRSDRAGESSRARRDLGLGIGAPAHGNRYVTRRRRLRNGRMESYLVQVPSEPERQALAVIVKLREQGWSYAEVGQMVAELGLPGRDGRGRSAASVRRAYLAGLEIQRKGTQLEQAQVAVREEVGHVPRLGPAPPPDKSAKNAGTEG
jgi:hypothetical protein